jgi:Bacterial protein of unknown function (DUF899)
VFLLTAHRTSGHGDEVMAPSYGLLDRTAYGRQEFWEDSPEGWPRRWGSQDGQFRLDGCPHRPRLRRSGSGDAALRARLRALGRVFTEGNSPSLPPGRKVKRSCLTDSVPLAGPRLWRPAVAGAGRPRRPRTSPRGDHVHMLGEGSAAVSWRPRSDYSGLHVISSWLPELDPVSSMSGLRGCVRERAYICR